MRETLLDRVQRHLPWLQSKAFLMERRGPDPQSFGNELLLYRIDSLLMRIYTDRGEGGLIDLASPAAPEEWFDIGVVRVLLCGNDLLKSVDLEDDAEFLSAYWTQVTELFNEANYATTVRKLNSLRQQRARLMFPSAFEDVDQGGKR